MGVLPLIAFAALAFFSVKRKIWFSYLNSSPILTLPAQIPLPIRDRRISVSNFLMLICLMLCNKLLNSCTFTPFIQSERSTAFTCKESEFKFAGYLLSCTALTFRTNKDAFFKLYVRLLMLMSLLI